MFQGGVVFIIINWVLWEYDYQTMWSRWGSVVFDFHTIIGVRQGGISLLLNMYIDDLSR